MHYYEFYDNEELVFETKAMHYIEAEEIGRMKRLLVEGKTYNVKKFILSLDDYIQREISSDLDNIVLRKTYLKGSYYKLNLELCDGDIDSEREKHIIKKIEEIERTLADLG